jgi:hypothetical protein
MIKFMCEYDRVDEVDADVELSESHNSFLRRNVFNFEVEEFHTYYVGNEGVWAHNGPCPETSGDVTVAKQQAQFRVH